MSLPLHRCPAAFGAKPVSECSPGDASALARCAVLMAAVAVAGGLLAGCGGGGGDGSAGDAAAPASASASSPVPAPPQPASGPTIAQRTAAANTAATTDPQCTAVQPFYWSVGDATGSLGGASAGTSAPVATTPMAIASASKWIYGAYVAQVRGGALTADDIRYLTLRSGYVDFDQCLPGQTVDECEAYENNGRYEAADDGKFYYNGGHMEKHAADNGLGPLGSAALADAINGALGTRFAYAQPQLPGGIVTDAADYGEFLRRIVAGELAMSQLLGADAVCTNPLACPQQAVYTPVPEENDHYSIGHWVEDDPRVGDGAFSSPGKFGFYPWISADKSLWGVIARRSDVADEQRGYESMLCARRIRASWIAGTPA
ncbi:MAG: hypothetical protein ACTHL8_19730 [Burkholderiaceae bacterium]